MYDLTTCCTVRSKSDDSTFTLSRLFSLCMYLCVSMLATCAPCCCTALVAWCWSDSIISGHLRLSVNSAMIYMVYITCI